ncbi:run domain Beclin-1-interacting and cysteine-rich domain-containing protein-like isoform X1 [Asterias rubens]|uniref:run domain Beclin-1-interacting and cysteine-rich domain-containing protein-like isoform X1 n=1 Tax=Asterias rubens TaxID=7604 RepID=UPI001455BD2F|nr:run domain Beclin-1-interacting and cysteine-rich domain-containing protein-like isoform X1 [Asterias rubens]
MAEPESGHQETQNASKQEHQELLWGLKFTVEGLLAAHTTNVWSTYGGLTRLCCHLDKVMCHRLRHPKGTSFVVQEDYWDFVLGLRQLQPVLAPSVDRIHRQAGEQGVDRGGMWLRTSLEAHTLASQLRLLVDDNEHLSKYYYDDAFLCSQAHFQALYICLLSVEQNNASILADLDPMLLSCMFCHSLLPASSQQRNLSARNPTAEMPIHPQSHRKLSASAEAVEPPAFASPKTESILTMSDEHAQPNIQILDRRQSESARTMLLSLLDNTSLSSVGKVRSVDDIPKTVNDPLMNMEFPTNDKAASPPQRKVLRHAKTISSLPSYAHQNRESKLLFDCGSPPSENTLPGSLGSLGSVNEDDSLRNTCKCIVKTKSRSFSDSAERESLNSAGSLSTESLNATQCERCGMSISPLTQNAVRLRRKLGTASSPPKARNSLYKTQKSLRHSQSSLALVDNGVKRKALYTHSRSKSEILKPPSSDIRGATADLDSSSNNMSNSLPSDGHIAPPRKTSLLESGMVSAATECYFPQPAQGQSLMSFLSSRDFERIPELDRENAHFSISEAIIAAIEQIRCRKHHRSVSDHESDASDEEIQHLKQRIRLRRTEKRRDKMRGRTSVIWTNENCNDSGMNTLTSSNTTLTSSSANSTPHDTTTESEEDSSDSSDSVEEFELSDSQPSNLLIMQQMGLSPSLASLYSDADICRQTSPQLASNELSPVSGVNCNTLSAESVALCLLRKFSAKQLPAASELQWLVSEQDAPQALLPMPKSLPVSPDDGENSDIYTKKTTRLRGNAEWAPPRAQIIFNVHPPPKRKVLVAKQNYRCAGCGMRVERGFAKRLRYCEYLGKYFCHSCHGNSTAVIPGRVLRKWDFQKVQVCNFSRELLEKMYEDPLFNILDINQALYRKVKPLNSCKELRTQLFFLKDFLKTCRLSQSLQATYESQPSHLLNEPHLYSLSDLHRVRSGEMETELMQLVEDAVTHVSQCQLCQAKGFICEVCNNDQDIIFPFQLQKTYQCQDCWACYHKPCFLTVESCPKCLRINQRKISQIAKKKEVFSDEEEELPSKR